MFSSGEGSIRSSGTGLPNTPQKEIRAKKMMKVFIVNGACCNTKLILLEKRVMICLQRKFDGTTSTETALMVVFLGGKLDTYIFDRN